MPVKAETAEEIQQETSRIPRQSKPQKKNTTKAEREALRTLWEDREITVLPADKGNATVILWSKDYDSKIRAILNHPLYTKLTADPTSKTERRTTALIKRSDIPEEDSKRLIPHASALPRLYGLPKIHNEGVPLRPIVNCIGSPT
jgi:hypothetical protein